MRWPWRTRSPRGSLRRFLLLWQLGSLGATAVAVTTWQLGSEYLHLAGLQDRRLEQTLGSLAQAEPEAWPAQPSSLHVRVSAMSGEWVGGDPALPPFPWAASLSPGQAPVFYVSQARGTLLRAAAILRSQPQGVGVQVVQVAEPIALRWPRWEPPWSDRLSMLYAAAAIWALVTWAGVRQVQAWLLRAQAAAQASTLQLQPEDVPDELMPIIEHTRALSRDQRAWVDEQRRFLADASHQLRTPMAVLRAQLQAAIAGEAPASEVLPQMLHTVDRATGLVGQLLSLTKLEQVKRQGGLPMVDVRDVARTAVLELAPLIAAKRLDFGLDEASFSVPADATMLGELLRNLLANAIHHAPDRARVGIVLRQGAGRQELIVWDEGPGIDDEVRPRLFHPFAAGKAGMGLGLSICRQIAEAMGATVDLHNRCDDGALIGVDAVVSWGQGP